MSEDILQIDYDQMSTIVGQFQSQADAVEQMSRMLDTHYTEIKGGGWEGAADAVLLKDGTVLDVKNYDFTKPSYSDFLIDMDVKKLEKQVNLRKAQYPNKPIRYVYSGVKKSDIPKEIVDKLESLEALKLRKR